MTECAADLGDPVITVTLTWGDDEDETMDLPPSCDDDEGMWWQTLLWPQFAMRYTTAPPSAWIPGQQLLAAVPDLAAVTMTAAVRGTDTETTEAQKVLLGAVLAQWPLQVTVTSVQGDEDPVEMGSWSGQPSLPLWGPVTPQRAGMYVAECSIQIPVNPVGSA